MCSFGGPSQGPSKRGGSSSDSAGSGWFGGRDKIQEVGDLGRGQIGAKIPVNSQWLQLEILHSRIV